MGGGGDAELSGGRERDATSCKVRALLADAAPIPGLRMCDCIVHGLLVPRWQLGHGQAEEVEQALQRVPGSVHQVLVPHDVHLGLQYSDSGQVEWMMRRGEQT